MLSLHATTQIHPDLPYCPLTHSPATRQTLKSARHTDPDSLLRPTLRLPSCRHMPARTPVPETTPIAPRSDEIRARNPKPFDGRDPSLLSTFIIQTSLALDARPSEFPDEKSKIGYAISYLEGDALEWAYTMFRMANPPPCMTDFSLFTEQLEQVFGENSLVAIEKFRQLRQTSTVAKYSSDFRRLANRVNWDDRSLHHQFYSGLNRSVKLELVRGNLPEKLEELISSAIAIDHLQQGNLAQLNSTPRPPDQPPRRDHRYGAPPTTSSGRHLTEQQREHRLRNNLCLYCGGEGHIIRSCPLRQPRPARAAVAALTDTEPPGNERTQSM
jgi:Ty3 transposon capsid-like protein